MKNYIYTITVTHIYEDGKVKSFVERICSEYAIAKALLESLYNDALNEYEGKHCQYSDPKWLDANTLQVTATMSGCGITCKTTEIYYINSEIKDNIYSKKSWIAE
jgi:hypothetical protein